MSKTTLIHIAERILNTPLLIHPTKAEVIFSILQERLGAGIEFDLELDENAPEASRFIGSQQRRDRPMGLSAAHKGVSIIPILGSLVNRGAFVGARSGMTSYEGLGAQFDDAAADDEIHTILMDVNSPGGEALGMFNLASKIRSVRDKKNVVAVVNDMCCSAAYGLASSADEIVVSPTSVVGSIGVVMMHLDRSGELAKKGIKPTFIFAGKHKVDGNSTEPLSDETRAELQRDVSSFYDQFLATVEAGRGKKLPASAARATEARTKIGAEAIEIGLADRLGTFESVLNELVTASSRRFGRTTSPWRLNMEKENAPAVNAGITQDQMNAAVASAVSEATAKATKAGADAERARIAAIVRGESAKGREAQALVFALDTSLTAEEAGKALAVSPVTPAANTIETRNAAAPEIGADGKPLPKKTEADVIRTGWGKAIAGLNGARVQ